MAIAAAAHGDVCAQALGVQPHIAKINQAAGAGGYSQPLHPTPLFDLPDGVWNNGESFRASSTADADYGGYLLGGKLGVELADIFDYDATIGGTPGWKPYSWTDPATGLTHQVQRLVGYLRPGQLGPYAPGPVEDAAFELFAPVNPDPSAPVVIAIGTWATTGWPDLAHNGRFGYPGTLPEGLVPDGNGILRHGYAAPDLTALADPTKFTVVSGYIVTRVFGRTLHLTLQRTRELRQAIALILDTQPTHPLHPLGVPRVPLESGCPCMVTGGSFGGLVSMTLCTRWPNEFHGGLAYQFGMSVRRVFADQYNLAYLAQKVALHRGAARTGRSTR